MLQLNYLIIRIQACDLVDSKKFLLIQLNFCLNVFTSEFIFSSFMQFIITVSLFLHKTLSVVLFYLLLRTFFSKSVLSLLSVFLMISFGTLLIFGLGLAVISANVLILLMLLYFSVISSSFKILCLSCNSLFSCFSNWFSIFRDSNSL